MPTILGANTLSTGYDVANSLRFNDGSSDYLSQTISSSTGKTFTISFWMKKSTDGSNNCIFGLSSDNNTNDYIEISTKSGSYGLDIQFNNGSGGTYLRRRTNRVFRDTSAWMHVVVRFDSTQGTASNRFRLYINGVQETNIDVDSSAADVPQDYVTDLATNGATLNIGRMVNASNYFDGYLCEVVLVDGSSLAPTSFGEFDANSPTIWKPIDVSGLTFGTNGFYLEFKQSGTSQNSSGLGADTSGQDNHFAVNNLTAVDQSTDTCTNNFLTWNPLDTTDPGDLTFSEGNLKVVNGTGVCRGTLAASSGKWYWEIKQITAVDASNPIQYGVADTEDSPPTHSSLNNALIAYSDNNTNKAIKKFAAGTESTITSTMGSFNNIAQNDIIQFAFDADTAKLWVGRNGTYLNSGDPANGTGEVASTNSGNFFTPCLEHAGVTYTIESNFGSPPYSISSGNTDANGHGNFEYSVPSGFFAWNTKNLAEFG